jgi:hypothetical protein
MRPRRRKSAAMSARNYRAGAKASPIHAAFCLAKPAIVPDIPGDNEQPGGLMPVRPGILSEGLALSVVIGLSFLATPSQAYTQDQQQLCTGDAFRLCSAVIPDVDRVTACMIQKRTQLSPGCAQFFREPAARATPVGARRPAAKSRKAKRPASAR